MSTTIKIILWRVLFVILGLLSIVELFVLFR